MIIVFNDELGSNATYVNEYGITFCDGYAHFSSDTRDYKIPIDHIQQIR